VKLSEADHFLSCRKFSKSFYPSTVEGIEVFSSEYNVHVWVAKEDREGCIACDYRDLNLIYSLFVVIAICMYIMSICSLCVLNYVV